MELIKKRSLMSFIVFNTLTLGIYGIVIFDRISRDIEKICEGDGKRQMRYVFVWLLSGITLGIFPLIWEYRQMERLADNAYRYGIKVRFNENHYILIWIFRLFLPNILLTFLFFYDLNQYSQVYGRIQPLPYTNNPFERERLQANIESASTPTPVQQYGAMQHAPSNASLFCTRGTYQGTKFDIPSNETILIGRDPSSCAVIITNSSGVSRKHLELRFDNTSNRYWVKDISSTGTFLANGNRLENGKMYQFSRGTRLRLGSSEEFILN